mmetsp:Transcript_1890/g.4217  ORF Transcript_1890/g.4217 Transcript_1890/m.4217 type:complete len:235 (-) Transcript_1890:262-966(-)
MPQRLLIVRHGVREDTGQKGWSKNATWPWDPALKEGCSEIDATALEIQRVCDVDVVVCSPFTRCLQTAAWILRELGPKGESAKLIVSRRFSEVFAIEHLFKDGATTWAHIKFTAWKQLWKRRAAALLPRRHVSFAPDPWPEFPEQKMDARITRYTSAVELYADQFPGKNILFVTHGDAVCASMRLVHDAVYDASSVACGAFVSLVRDLPESGDVKGGKWTLGPTHNVHIEQQRK